MTIQLEDKKILLKFIHMHMCIHIYIHKNTTQVIVTTHKVHNTSVLQSLPHVNYKSKGVYFGFSDPHTMEETEDIFIHLYNIHWMSCYALGTISGLYSSYM